MSFCCFGVCIPYNVLLPVVIVFIKQIYDFCMRLIGKGGNIDKAETIINKNKENDNKTCCCNDNIKNNDNV